MTTARGERSSTTRRIRLAAPRSAFTGRPSEPLIELGRAKNALKKIESPSTMSSG
jgi:hypothetical protein